MRILDVKDNLRYNKKVKIKQICIKDKRDLVKKREDLKRLVVFCLASLVVIAQTAVFAYIWYDFYRGLIFEPFWRKGNWVLIAIYGLINVLFSRLYGGLKVGYLKRIDVFYSMILATLCTNVVTYFQITLINRWFLDAWPMVEMTLVQFVIILVWIWGSRYCLLYTSPSPRD